MSEEDSNNHRVRLVPAIAQGTVIDHLPPEVTLKVVDLVAQAEDEVLVGLNFRSRHFGRKGVVKINGRELTPSDLNRLSLIAPEATMSIIRDYKVISKGQVELPEAYIGIARCPNPNCVTNHETCTSRFKVTNDSPLMIRCHYCERDFPASEVNLI